MKKRSIKTLLRDTAVKLVEVCGREEKGKKRAKSKLERSRGSR